MSVERNRQEFTHAVRSCYGDEFLNRPPSLSELRALEDEFAGKLFPGCVSSVDCIYLVWKN